LTDFAPQKTKRSRSRVQRADRFISELRQQFPAIEDIEYECLSIELKKPDPIDFLSEFIETAVKGSLEKFEFEGSIATTAAADFARHQLSSALQHSVPSLNSHPKGTGTREIVNGFASFPGRAPNTEAVIRVITSPKLIVCEVIV
jgi:hypothetical protein